MFLATHEKEFKSPVPIGTVTLMSIAGNMPRESLDLAEVEIPSSTNKPTSNFGDNQHADQTRLETNVYTANQDLITKRIYQSILIEYISGVDHWRVTFDDGNKH